MRVYRLVINEGTNEIGVVFEIDEFENNRSGRAIISVPQEVLEPLWEAAKVSFQKALEEAEANERTDDLTSELHRLRALKQKRKNLNSKE